MATERVLNFNPGPATLPLPVLERAQAELTNYQNSGMSVMEISHRSQEYAAINAEAETLFKQLCGIGDDYRVLFLQGGASLQFVMAPTNFLHSGRVANYVMTGSWSDKALAEAAKLGPTHIAASSKEDKYTYIPAADAITLSTDPAYVHITTNNTIAGTQWQTIPDFGGVPLIADASSDILSRPFPVENFALLYGGAQKNLGPAGVTAVLIRQSLLEQEAETIPNYLRYSTHVKASSLYNTPPAFTVYILKLVLEWLRDQGGLEAIGNINEQKAKLVYDAVDGSGGYYRSPVRADSRSWMNIVFRLPSEELEQQFIDQAKHNGMIGLKGHRSVGGIRVSLYNAMPLEGAQAIASFMQEFMQQNG